MGQCMRELGSGVSLMASACELCAHVYANRGVITKFRFQFAAIASSLTLLLSIIKLIVIAACCSYVTADGSRIQVTSDGLTCDV